VDGAPDGLEVLHGHPQHGQLVQLPGHGVAHGHHGRQLGDVCVHFVAPPLLDLTVVLPGMFKNATAVLLLYDCSMMFFESRTNDKKKSKQTCCFLYRTKNAHLI
jgi:hypothetical protein